VLAEGGFGADGPLSPALETIALAPPRSESSASLARTRCGREGDGRPVVALRRRRASASGVAPDQTSAISKIHTMRC